MRKYFPHLNINVRDASGGTIPEETVLPLFRPVFSVKTAKGALGVPVWCPNETFAKQVFGEEFLDKNNADYFSRTSVFISGILKTSGCYIVRLGLTATPADELVKAGTVVNIVWTHTVAGETVTDTWAVTTTPLGSDTVEELLDEQLNINNAGIPTVTTTLTVPVMVVAAKNEGLYGNSYGFNISINSDSTAIAEIDELNSMLFKFGVVKKASRTSTVTTVLNQYSLNTFNFAISDTVVDPLSGTTVGMESMLPAYWDETLYPCPVDVTMFNENIAYLYEVLRLAAVAENPASPSSLILTNRPYSVNLFTLKTTTDADAELAVITGFTVSGTDFITGGTNVMLTGGSDGALNVGGVPLDNNAAIETAIVNLWSVTDGGMLKPELMDRPRYPFNMVVDTGYGVDVKNAFIDLLGVCGDIKPVVATWAGVYQDPGEAVTTGNTLRNRIVGFKESELYNTQAFQAVMFGSAAKETDRSVYRKKLPLTYEYCLMLAKLHNSTYLKGHPEGEAAYFTKLTDPDWTAYSYNEAMKALLWRANVNYPQYYNNTGIHFAGIRSVYNDETSLFANDSFVNVAVYVKQVLPEVWAKYASVTGTNEDVYGDALRTLNKRLEHMLAGMVAFKTSMYQTAAEAAVGYEHHLQVELFDDNGLRILNADIVAKRSSELA